jgi:predicted acylesterase/phospholipase RssA
MNETKNYSITKSGAVILEGGANRGVFTAGALDFLMEQEYYIPHVIGVSAGACNALDYVSRQIGRTRDCMIVTDEKNRYVNKNIKTIVEKKALLDMDMVFERYPYEIFPFDFDTYFASPQTCELVVTNCETGRAEYLDDRENKERLLAIGRASSSMPIACPMVEIDGNEYVDGGVADSIPIIRSLKTGHLKIIAGFSFQQRGKLLFEHLIVHFFPPFLFDCLLYFCFTEQKKLRKTQLKNLCTDLYMPEIRWFAELRTMRKTGPDCFRQPLSAIFQTNILFI